MRSAKVSRASLKDITGKIGISDISTVVEDNANGVTSVADSIVTLAAAIGEIQQETTGNQEISRRLNDEVNRFKQV